MANEKFSKLEARAIQRHIEEFRGSAMAALLPIVSAYMGNYDAGTIAEAAVGFALQHRRARFEETALKQLEEKFDYLARLLEPQPEIVE